MSSAHFPEVFSVGITSSADSFTVEARGTALEWNRSGGYLRFRRPVRVVLQPSERDWMGFWQTIDRLGVWSWGCRGKLLSAGQRAYSDVTWHVRLSYSGRTVDVAGHNAYPPNGAPFEPSAEFELFCKAVNKILQGARARGEVKSFPDEDTESARQPQPRTTAELVDQLAATIRDYRKGEISPPTPQHVARWLGQFPEAVHHTMLEEFLFVWRSAYFSEERIRALLSSIASSPGPEGSKPEGYWRRCNFLRIQAESKSQERMLRAFGSCLQKEFGFGLDQCGAPGGPFVFLDDVLFTGDRIKRDMESWFPEAPEYAQVRIVTLGAHTAGIDRLKDALERNGSRAAKRITVELKCLRVFEDRQEHADEADVLRPVRVPDGEAAASYYRQIVEAGYNMPARTPAATQKSPIFQSESGRQCLEEQLLLVGLRIIAACREPKRFMRPLGYHHPPSFGFGSLVVPYWNCPNNAPLALWWGDPSAPEGHSLKSWYPLLPRKTYEKASYTRSPGSPPPVIWLEGEDP